jgi:mRNA interferase RelE/StbE
MTYKVSLKPGVIKTLKHINEPYYSKIKEAIYKLAENPRPYGYIKLKKRNGYRIRVGDFRIIYDIEDAMLWVEVIALGNRKETYG